MADQQPDPIDVFAGERLRARRKFLGMSQQALADAVGITFQQVQKYERGANRISVSKLARMARALQASPAEFFPGIEDDDSVRMTPIEALAHADGGIDLARRYCAMSEERRHALLRVAAALTDEEAAEPGPAYVAGGDMERPRHVA